MAQTTSVAITFTFLDRYAYWLLDDVKLVNVNTSIDLLQNGGFENGSLTGWNYYQANNNASEIVPNSSAFTSRNGLYSFAAKPYPAKDYLTQIIQTKLDYFYKFSFWLSHKGGGANSSVTVTLIY